MKTTKLLIQAALIATFTLTATAQQVAAPKSVTLFSNVRIFDGKKGELSAPSHVLVRGNKIEKISTAPIPTDRSATTLLIDGGGRTLGRKPVVTPERVEMICGLIAHGESEKSACIRAGIGLTAWNTAKRSDAALRQRIAEARDEWARLRHARHAAALYESQSMRAANRKAVKPHPTHQAKLVAWHLTYRIPLHFAAIPETEIKEACERFNLSFETWTRQERAFGLLRKVYAKRARIRGEQPPITANIISWP